MKFTHPRFIQFFFLALAAAVGTEYACAANYSKLDTTSMQLTAANWSGTPSASDIGEFGNIPTTTTLAGLILGGNVAMGGLRFDNNLVGPVTIASGSILTLNNGGTDIDMSAANQNVTINCVIALGAAQTWNVNTGQSLLVNSSLNLNGKNLTKTGPGTLTVANTSVYGVRFTINDSTFTMSEGALNINPGTYFTISDNSSGGTGAYVQTGGSATANPPSGTYIGNTKAGSLTVSGGSFTGNTLMDVRTSGSSVTVGGGAGTATITTPTMVVEPGCFLNILTNGTLVVGASGVTHSGSGTWTLAFDGGTLKASANSPSLLASGFNCNINAGGAFIDDSGFDIVISQALGAGSPSGGLTKNGTGSLTLSGSNTYTGDTIVNAGKLVVGSAQTAAGAIRVNDNAVLSVTVSGANQLSPVMLAMGSSHGPTTMEFTGVTSTTMAPVKAGTLTHNGTTTINIISGTFVIGHIYPLVNCTNLTGTGNFVLGSMPSGLAATVVNSSGGIALSVTGMAAPVWNGLINSNWDTNNTANWSLNGVGGKIYQNGSKVLFDDTASGTTTVNASTTVFPGSVTVNNTSKAFTIGGSPVVSGGALIKSGTNTLTLASADSFNGGTLINAGTLVLSGPGALLNTPTITLASGATFNVSGVTGGYTLRGGQSLLGSGTVIGSVTVDSGAAIDAGSAGDYGAITITGDLTFSTGSRCGLDVSAASNGSNDLVHVMGNVTLDNTLFHLKASATTDNLDIGSDYVLVSGTSISGSPVSTPVWDVPPLNASHFVVLNNGTQVVLHYTSLNRPGITAGASPASLAIGQTTTISATVTDGSSATITSVIVDASAIGGSPATPLLSNGGNLYTADLTVASDITPGSKTLVATVTDGNNLQATVTFSVSVAPPTWGSNAAIIWHSNSQDSLDSMPLSGRLGAGANVWVQDGSLWLYLGHNGAYNEQGILQKLGCVRITPVDGSLTNAAGFTQTLDPSTGTITIQQGTFNASLWFAGATLMIESNSSDPQALDIAFATWRDQTRAGQKLDLWGTFTMTPDTVVADGSGFSWWHRNADFPFDVTGKAAAQGIPAGAVHNPTANRVSGGALAVDGGLTTPAAASVQWQYWNGTAWTGRTTAKTNHTIAIALRGEINGDPNQWRGQAVTALTPAAVASAKADEAARWAQFWSRSHIMVNPALDANDDGWLVGRNYQLFRYMLACNRGGELPLLFNGGIFTTDNVPGRITGNNNSSLGISPGAPSTPDSRRWLGTHFMPQNQRWLGWPTLAAGDADLLASSLVYFRDHAATAAARAQTNGAEGVVYPEGLDIWGLGSVSPGANGFDTNAHLVYHFSSMLQFAWLALQGHDTLGISITADLPWIEGTVRFYDSYYRARCKARTGSELGTDGKLVIYPCNSVELLGGATNPVDVVAGLECITTGLLTLTDLPSDVRENFTAIKARLPSMPTGSRGGVNSVLPANSWQAQYNPWEFPEMYAAYPYRLIGITKPETLQLARNTWNSVPLRGDNQSQMFCKDYDYSWQSQVANTAALAWPDQAKQRAIYKLANNSAPQARFPAFFGPGHDWLPDHNWGGTGMVGLQEMLLAPQPGPHGKLYLFPAWPKSWDVHFKLMAPGSTTVEGVLQGGNLVSLKVTPASRANDIVNCLNLPPNYQPGTGVAQPCTLVMTSGQLAARATILADVAVNLTDLMTITGFDSVSTQGGTITMTNNQLFYVPSEQCRSGDTFNFTLLNSNNVVSSATATIYIITHPSYNWDANGATSGAGGTGTWDHVSTNWDDGTNVWPGDGISNWALIGGSSGTLSLATGGVAANGLDFKTDGYIIQGDTLTLNGTNPVVLVESNVNVSINSVVAGAAGLTKLGEGTLTLRGANTYTGPTTVSNGTVTFSGSTFTMSGLHVAAGASADFTANTYFDFIPPITGSGTVIIENQSGNSGFRPITNNQAFAGTFLTQNGGNIDFTSTVAGWSASASYILNGGAMRFYGMSGKIIELGALSGTNASTTIGTWNANTPTLSVGALGSSTTFAGRIVNTANGGGGGVIFLTKVGSGTLCLTGDSTYTGATTVNAGSLVIDGSLGTTAVTVTSGACLGGAGTIAGAVTINPGAIMAPGNAGTGTLTVASATLGGTYHCQLDVAAGDRISVTGSLTVSPGADITVSMIGTPAAASYTIASYGTLSGTLPVVTGIPSGYALDTTTPGQIKLVVIHYDAWAAANAGGGTPDQDFDHDGVKNGIEYFMGQTGASVTANLVMVNGKITWPRNPAADATYVVEVSTNLKDEATPGDGGWTPATSGVVDHGTSIEFTPPTGDMKFFTRLKVIIP